VIEDPGRVAERVSIMARERRVVAVDGSVIPLHAATICVHGDTPGAEALVVAIRARLAADGVEVKSFCDPG
jgi:UPF0271 protein